MVAAVGIPSSPMSLWPWWMINQCQGTGPSCEQPRLPWIEGDSEAGLATQHLHQSPTL